MTLTIASLIVLAVVLMWIGREVVGWMDGVEDGRH
jgi:hypothetical protein